MTPRNDVLEVDLQKSEDLMKEARFDDAMDSLDRAIRADTVEDLVQEMEKRGYTPRVE